MELVFEAELWEWQGQGAWCFVTLPADYSKEVKLLSAPPRKGFGSVRVVAQVGNTIWKTSIFPDSKSKCYVLPIKKLVRNAELLKVGNGLCLKVTILDI